MKPALAWIEKVIAKPEDRKNRRWLHTKRNQRVMETAAERRSEVLQFKEECETAGIAFASDREAWEAFKEDYPGARMAFAGDSADAAIDVVACRNWARIWRTIRRRQVHFDGDGTVVNAPTVLTLGQGKMKTRTDPLQALFLTDPEERALAQPTIRETAKRLHKKALTIEEQASYLDKLDLALTNNGVAVENEITGEIIVQALLPGVVESNE